MPRTAEAARAVHDALSAYLDDGELVIGWAVVIDVAGPNDTRYLAHRYGGGHDGGESPTVWTALGMPRGGALAAEEQLRDGTRDYEEDDDDSD